MCFQSPAGTAISSGNVGAATMKNRQSGNSHKKRRLVGLAGRQVKAPNAATKTLTITNAASGGDFGIKLLVLWHNE